MKTVDAILSTSWAPARSLLQAWNYCWCCTWSTACVIAASAKDYRTAILPATRAIELSPLACGYSLLGSCFTNAKEVQRRSVLRAGHVMSLHLGIFSPWGAYAAKQDANAMAMRRLASGGSPSFASNTTTLRLVNATIITVCLS